MSNPAITPKFSLQRIINISLLIYPAVAHIGILLDQVLLSVCYLIAIIYLNSIKLLAERNKALIILFTLLTVFLFYTAISSESLSFIIFIPPVLIPCWLAYIFLGTLKSKEDVITIIAKRIEGKELDQRHLLYTRRLTALWGIAFLLMIFEAIVLAIWAPFEVWSWWVHVGNYIIVAALFLIEMTVRHRFIGQRVRLFRMISVLSRRNWHD